MVMDLKKTFCLTLSLLNILSLSHGASFFNEPLELTTVINGSSNLQIEYQSLLLNRPHWVSYSKSLQHQFLNHPLKEKIKDLFLVAQSLYLKGLTPQAQKTYQSIVKLRFQGDWDPPSVRIILLSLLRLYELEKTPKENWLLLAKQYSPYWTPDPQTFSQKTIEAFNEINIQWLELDPKTLAHPKIAIVNGRHLDVAPLEPLSLPKGTQRLVLLYDDRPPLIHVGEALQARPPHPFEWGTCQQPQTIQPTKQLPEKYKVFYSLECIKDVPKLFSLLGKTSSSRPIPQPRSQPFYKRTWFWLTLTGLATLALIASNKDSSPKKQRSSSPPPPVRLPQTGVPIEGH